MPEGVQAIVLCEGLQDWVFIRRVLVKMGYEDRRIRRHVPQKGRGAGEQYVRLNYPGELRAFRSRAARTKTVLVVHTDADTLTVDERIRTLEEQLRSEGIPPRKTDDAVAILVPKRNIETWIHCLLTGKTVDEETVSPKYEGHESDTHPAADEFAKWVRIGAPGISVPISMVVGIAEARRVL